MGKVYLAGGPVDLSVPLPVPAAGTALSDCTPLQIQAAARAGVAPSLWAVGDVVPITLNGTVGKLTFANETYYAFILGFNHNSTREGNNTIHFQFGKTADGKDIAFVDSTYSQTDASAGFRMNIENNTYLNVGGWNNSYMRRYICPAFLSAMTEEWQSIIMACTKYSDNSGGGYSCFRYVSPTEDTVFLLSEFEVFGTQTNANPGERSYQKQYDYYKNGNSRIKYQHTSESNTCHWFLRSVYGIVNSITVHPSSFCCVDTRGQTSTKAGNQDSGFAPAFMVA